MGNIIVGITLLLIVLLIIRKLIKDKKSGNGCSGCNDGCNCCSTPIEKNKEK